MLISKSGGFTDDHRRLQGAWLFLLSLAVFFVSCVILYAIYVVLRLRGDGSQVQPFDVPFGFIFTTIALIATSICMHLAIESVRRERRTDLLRYLVLSCILSVVFFAIQAASMLGMVTQFNKASSPNGSLYGLTFFLALLHAVHVIGGIVALALVLIRTIQGRYDHERYFPIHFCALYWHFLDFVWLCMLASFAIAAFMSKA